MIEGRQPRGGAYTAKKGVPGVENDLFLISTNFFHSCEALVADPRGPNAAFVNIPALQVLLGFTLELSLKAVLQADGLLPEDVAGLGHDLLKAYRLVQERHALPRTRNCSKSASAWRRRTRIRGGVICRDTLMR